MGFKPNEANASLKANLKNSKHTRIASQNLIHYGF